MNLTLILQYALSLLVLAVVLWGLGALKRQLHRLSVRLSERASIHKAQRP